MSQAANRDGTATGVYGLRQVANLLGLTDAQIRWCVRTGLIEPNRGPRGELRFSFQDLVLFRTMKDLADARVPSKRLHRAFRRLRRALPANQSLSGIRISADGGEIIARDGQGAWAPDSGQMVLDFARPQERKPDVLDLEEALMGFPSSVEIVGSAEDWYLLGCELEDGHRSQARAAYEKALELDPAHAHAHVNLGSLVHEEGDLRRAELHYRAAVESEPDNSVAVFNLGVSLEDQGRLEEALVEYQRSIDIDADNPDAHYNLAHLYHQIGDGPASIRHLKAYRKLTSDPKPDPE